MPSHLTSLPALQIDTQNVGSMSPLRAFQQGEEDQLAQNQRNLLKEVGGQAATGNYLKAAQVAMGGGDLETGMKLNRYSADIGNMSADKRLKLVNFLAEATNRADTPEKWKSVIDLAGGVFGQDKVAPYADFNNKGAALRLLSQTKQKLEIKEVNGQIVGIDPTTGAARVLHDSGHNGPKPPAGYQWSQTARGELEPIPGGPAAVPRARAFSVGDITRLSEEGGKYANVTSFAKTFQDRFSGYTPGTGDIRMMAGRAGYAGKDTRDAANWWQGYDRYKNVIRNDLFGSALTPAEQQQWEKADITPTMDPTQVRENLKIQKNVLTAAIKRKANALVTAGYDSVPIVEAYGLSPDDLKEIGISTSRKRPPPPRFDQIPSGSVSLLRSDPSPEARREFDELYGAGAADRFLGAE